MDFQNLKVYAEHRLSNFESFFGNLGSVFIAAKEKICKPVFRCRARQKERTRNIQKNTDFDKEV